MDISNDNLHIQNEIDFDPVIFLRCHSKTDKDFADVKVQVWQAVFEPKESSVSVATCGGNKVCIINVATGDVEQRYSCDDSREILYAVAWGVIEENKKRRTILVAGGVKCLLYFICPTRHVKLFEYKISSSKKNYITCLTFHPHRNNLFCSMNNGSVICYKITTNDSSSEIKLHQYLILTVDNEIITTAFCPLTMMLLVATDKGLQGWCLNNENYDSEHPKLLRFRLNNSFDSDGLVDSVEIIGDGITAAKWALNSFIYVWNMRSVKYDSTSICTVIPTHVLKWRDTDNYYMGIGASYDAKIVACGDDKGCIWIYDISEVIENSDKRYNQLEARKIVQWPILSDRFATKSRKLDLDVYDIVIAKTAVHSSGQYIVAVTNNNLVCIWKLNNTE